MSGTGFERELITPEGIDLKLRLGDAGERVAAFFLDVMIVAAALGGLTLAVLALGLVTHFSAAAAMGAIWLLGFFLLRNFYFMSFELTARAATPGKRVVGLRVAMRDGSPLTANAVFARNALRELEIFLPLSFMVANSTDIDTAIGIVGTIWCGVFVFFPLFNRDRLRLGDLIAGTWVVVAPKKRLDPDLSTTMSATHIVFTSAALDAYGIKELNILENVLRRRDAATMAAVAKRIRAKTGFSGSVADQDFLSAYYVALRGRLENRLLFGKRRRDKHDTV